MRARRQRRDDLENQLNKGALWAVTYGDLMSYMMIFFLIMFTFGLAKAKGNSSEQRRYHQSLVNIQKVFGGRLSSKDLERAAGREKEESMAAVLQQAFDDQKLSQFAKVETKDTRVRLMFTEAVLFDSGSADMKKDAFKILSSVAGELRPLPNIVEIEGHTDNVPVRGGRFRSNWELSVARAFSVLRFLESQGVAPTRLAAIGYGEHRPVGDNATPEGRSKNRRIEISLVRGE
jgi:chemotaxis protein MotB